MTERMGLQVDTLTIRIPIRLHRRGGRKRIVAPDGSELVRSSKPQADGTVVKALARAWRWQRQLDEEFYSSVSDIGEAEGISKSYVSRILRLALLAPDIIEAILGGRTDQSLMLERLERPLPAGWEEQRRWARGLNSSVTLEPADTERISTGPASATQELGPAGNDFGVL
jgi:ParB-like chromosome segregation protein Spo0J